MYQQFELTFKLVVPIYTRFSKSYDISKQTIQKLIFNRKVRLFSLQKSL